MKYLTRLLAMLLLVSVLLGAIACTPTSVPPAVTETEAPGDTLPATDPEATEPTTEAETETEEAVSPANGAISFFGPDEIKKCRPTRMATKLQTDAKEGDYLVCTVRGADPWITLARTEADAVNGARFMRIRYRTSSSIAGRLFLGETQLGESGSLPVNYVTDGVWHTLEVDLWQSATYSSTLAALRYDPMDGTDPDNEAIDIAWIGFYPDVAGDPTADLPPLPEDAPNLSAYEQTEDKSVYYRASGYITGEKGVYTFKSGFALDLYRRGYFNRYTVGYSSTSPLKGEITYLMWDEKGESVEKTEEFFLEAGDNQLFHSLIDDYARNKYAYGVKGMSLSTCDGSTATFTLHSLTDTAWEVYTGTYYIENDHYKLGILLSWGGGISYIEDKQDGDARLGNLINRADPGRLIQQSYYGVGDGPHYTGAYYNGTMWSYNPVQGGDQHGNGSKLVDVRVDETNKTVYVKCQPMDWAHNASPTPSYMENTYILEADGIHVQNRFVDFFGVKHPDGSHAELPAFYTISYLGTFHYYNGNRPWTNDAYETLPNEPFWAGNGDAYHNIVPGNTETWAAWTNEAGYGIGLYVPGTEIMLAGRHMYNGSKDPANGATNYVAPLRTMEMVSFVPFEYEYFIATGTVDEMREIFKDYAN